MSSTIKLGVCAVLSTLMAFSTGALADDSLKPTSSSTVYFRGWAFNPDLVQKNVDRYNSELGGHVDYETVTGDYPQLIENRLIAGDNVDLLYGDAYTAYRLLKGGYISTVDDVLPNTVAAVKADMYPTFVDYWSVDGKLMGLPYFVGNRGVIQVNLKLLSDLGISEDQFPANWRELYDMIYMLKDKHNVETPYLPTWFTDAYGISWGFIMEVLNRGSDVADPVTHKPILSETEGPAYETLKDWKKAYNGGYVPKDVITMRDSDFVAAWTSGKYAFSPHEIYDLATFNDPTRSKLAGHLTILPYKGQSWGVLSAGLYLLSSRTRTPESQEDAARFLSWYGYKDHEGKLYVANNWAQKAFLFSGYKSVNEDPANEARISAALARPGDYATMLDVFSHAQYPKGVWNVVWSTEFNTWLRDELNQFLANDRPIDLTIREINQKITDLNQQYGIN